MKQKYEYRFVKIGEGWMGVKSSAKDQYEEIVHEYARNGWRFVQVFAPSFGTYGISKFVELIFEREIQS